MLHLSAFLESVDAGAAYNSLNGVQDDLVRVVTTTLAVPLGLPAVPLVAGGVGSGGQGHVRLFSPSLRGRSRFVVAPINGANDGNVEPDSPQRVTDMRASPLMLTPLELLQAEIHSDTTAAAIQWCLVWLADGPIAPITGDIFTSRATGTATLVANSWTAVTLTFDEDLQVGSYDIVGMRALSAGCIAARVLFVGGGAQASWRPGVMGVDAVNDLEFHGFRNGGMGSFGVFTDTDLPQVEFLSLSADTAETVIFDLIKR
jgi:hypothetical protein